MIFRSMTILGTWINRAFRAYLTDVRVSIPATVGIAVGLWFLNYLERFGILGDATGPLRIPEIFFGFLVVASFAVGFAAIGKRALDRHFPQNKGEK